MKIEKFVLGILSTNSYIVSDENKNAVIFDCGVYSATISSYIEENELKLKKILLTHSHFDHIGGCAQLQEQTGAPVYIHEAEEDSLNDGDKNLANAFPFSSFEKIEDYRTISDGDVIKVGDMQFKVMHTPGHSKGSVCYIIEDVIFAGDTVFAGSVGRTDNYGGNQAEQRKSLKRLIELDGDYKLLCGHGEDTTLDVERKHNPYLQRSYYDAGI